MEFFGVLVFFVFFIGMFAFFIRRARKVSRAWKKAADKLGLDCDTGWFNQNEIKGTYNERPLKITVNTRGGGKSQQSFTRLEVPVEGNLPEELELTNESFFNQIGQFFGRQDIEVGNREFDETVEVKGANPEEVRNFITPEITGMLTRLFRNHRWSQLTDDRLIMEQSGTVQDADVLIGRVEFLYKLLRLLEGNPTEAEQRSEQKLKDGLEAVKRGDMKKAREQFEESAQSDPHNVEALLQKGNTLYMEERYEESEDVFSRALEIDPDDREAREWLRKSLEQQGLSDEKIKRRIDQYTSEPDGEEPPPPSSNEKSTTTSPEKPGPPLNRDSSPESRQESTAVEQPSQSRGPDPATLAQSLLDPSIASHEASETFENNFKGESITWKGTIEKTEDLTFDNVFENTGSGTKVTTRLFESIEDSPLQQQCHAVACFPGTNPEEFETGETIQWTGTLYKFDGFLRNIFISQASPV
ncbi:MAG: tetratricopeptide repeat protein [bacterium]